MNPNDVAKSNRELLTTMGHETPESLPSMENESELYPQDSTSCARRVMVLTYILGFGFNAKPDDLKRALDQYGLYKFCSDHERSLFNKQLSEQEKVNCSWLTECIQVFAWAFGRAELNHYQRCDDDLSTKFPDPFSDPSEFITTAELRPFNELYQMADMYYRLHWASRDARLMGKETELHEGLISERRKTLDWIIGVEGNWDEIPMDT